MDQVSTLLERARTATALSDFGDESFREGLSILVASMHNQAKLSAQGQEMFDVQIIGLPSERLHVEHWCKIHPEIEDQEIEPPLIGLGLPCTCSTAFGCMLGEDPGMHHAEAAGINLNALRHRFRFYTDRFLLDDATNHAQ